MARFWINEPNLIESGEGSIRIRGRAGLDVAYQGESVRVSSEMLAPPMTIALFTRGQDAIDFERGDEILDFVVRVLEFAGFTVERARMTPRTAVRVRGSRR